MTRYWGFLEVKKVQQEIEQNKYGVFYLLKVSEIQYDLNRRF